LENLLTKLQTDPAHNYKGGKETLSQLLKAEIQALLKLADKDHSGTITFEVRINILDPISSFYDFLNLSLYAEFNKFEIVNLHFLGI
jgi:hypothetical protein